MCSGFYTCALRLATARGWCQHRCGLRASLLLLRRDGSSDSNDLQLGRRRWRCGWVRGIDSRGSFSAVGGCRHLPPTFRRARFGDLLLVCSLATAGSLGLLLVHIRLQVLDLLLALFTLLLASFLSCCDFGLCLARNFGQLRGAGCLSTSTLLCLLLDLVLLLLLGLGTGSLDNHSAVLKKLIEREALGLLFFFTLRGSGELLLNRLGKVLGLASLLGFGLLNHEPGEAFGGLLLLGERLLVTGGSGVELLLDRLLLCLHGLRLAHCSAQTLRACLTASPAFLALSSW